MSEPTTQCDWKTHCVKHNIPVGFGCKRPFLLKEMDKAIGYFSQMICACVGIVGFLIFLVWYCVVQIVQIIQLYRVRNADLKVRQNAISINMPQDYTSPSNDNEEYQGKLQTLDGSDAETRIADDDFFKMNIEQRIALYKVYNDKLRDYYQKNKPNETPEDVIDTDIFDKSKDDYGFSNKVQTDSHYVVP